MRFKKYSIMLTKKSFNLDSLLICNISKASFQSLPNNCYPIIKLALPINLFVKQRSVMNPKR